MKKFTLVHLVMLGGILSLTLSCQKEFGNDQLLKPQKEITRGSINSETPPFNLEVILRGEGKQFGLVKFRQDVDVDKIVTLDTRVRFLEPNHEYLLQRAVDSFDGNCTSTSWLTLGKGLTPQSIHTYDDGTGNENLWRDISTIPSGTAFDIHFRVVDATSMAVIMNSESYNYVVR
jgi:hypothetical protein